MYSTRSDIGEKLCDPYHLRGLRLNEGHMSKQTYNNTVAMGLGELFRQEVT